MLHAAAMLTGLGILWLLFAQQWRGPEDIAVALGAALVCVVLSARLGGFGRGSAFTHGVQLVVLAFTRTGAVIGGALSTIRSALAADVTLKPALVRVKMRDGSDFARAALADMIGAAPGALVVEADAEGLLVHVLDEEAIDAENLGRLEARVIGVLDGKRRA